MRLAHLLEKLTPRDGSNNSIYRILLFLKMTEDLTWLPGVAIERAAGTQRRNGEGNDIGWKAPTASDLCA